MSPQWLSELGRLLRGTCSGTIMTAATNTRPTTKVATTADADAGDDGSPTSSSSRGGDDVVYNFDINQPSLPTPFHSVLVSIYVCMALSTAFHSIYSRDNTPLFSLCSSCLISVVLVLSTTYLFMKVSISLDIISCG